MSEQTVGRIVFAPTAYEEAFRRAFDDIFKPGTLILRDELPVVLVLDTPPQNEDK